jgi:hypothetical protein
MKYRMVVTDSFLVAGRGLVATGAADAKPKIGDVTIWLPDGSTETGHVSGIERYAIANWHRHPIGLLLRGRQSVPVGSVVEGDADTDGA